MFCEFEYSLITVNQLSAYTNKGIIFEIPVTQVSVCIFIFDNIKLIVTIDFSNQYAELYSKARIYETSRMNT